MLRNTFRDKPWEDRSHGLPFSTIFLTRRCHLRAGRCPVPAVRYAPHSHFGPDGIKPFHVFNPLADINERQQDQPHDEKEDQR
jgi:hypothetical protein